MSMQSDIYSGTALDSRTFQSTKHIATKGHMAVWVNKIVGNTWLQMSIGDYQLINNSCVLNELLDSSVYDKIEIRVADNEDELVTSISDIATVASISEEIVKVSNNEDNITNVSGMEDDINTVVSIKDDIVIDSQNKDDISFVADSIRTGDNISTGGQFLGNSLIGSVMYASQSTTDNLLLKDGQNGLIIDSLTVEGSGSIEIQGNAVLVVV